jgi:hypothetical protein
VPREDKIDFNSTENFEKKRKKRSYLCVWKLCTSYSGGMLFQSPLFFFSVPPGKWQDGT